MIHPSADDESQCKASERSIALHEVFNREAIVVLPRFHLPHFVGVIL
jgi:hypothetical protein